MSPHENDKIPPKPAFPRRFGSRFILLKEIGVGGMGHVFLSLTGQAGISRVCALKVLKDLRASQDAEELTQRFFDEAKVVTKLSHENLVYVFDFGIEDRQGFLAMEYVQGKTLTEVWNRCAVRRDGFAVGLSLHLIAELVSGLGYANRINDLGLVHRDISPSNVMLTYTGSVKLIDFGLAKWKAKVVQTATGIQWGKTSYMSPEQHLGKPVDHRSDLFSAGVILWELLTGRQLFPATETRAFNKPIPPPSYFSLSIQPALDRVVGKALALAPEERFQTGDEMAAALLEQMPPEAGNKSLAARFMGRLFETEIRNEIEEQTRLVESAHGLIEGSPPSLSAIPQANATIQEENAVPNPDGLIGVTLSERYFIRRLVGEGAMGRVYEGHHTGIGKRVAIKIAHRSERRKTELAKRFHREALAPAQIGHPNIADVTDCGTTPAGDFYFVMEYIDGVELEAILRRDGKLSVERSLLITIQVCRALEAAHAAGIIHRDLKPSNVMLVRTVEDGDDTVKVLDFGVAKFLRETSDGDLTLTNATVGTPRYMAPEQIRSGGTVDFRADIYAVGGILYAMLSGGKIPVEGATPEEIWQRKLTLDPKPLRTYRSDLPEALEKLVLRCLSRDPASRPSSAEILRKQLLAHLEICRTTGESLLAIRAPSKTAVVQKRIQGRQIKLGIAIGLVTAVLITLGGIALFRASFSSPAASEGNHARDASSLKRVPATAQASPPPTAVPALPASPTPPQSLPPLPPTSPPIAKPSTHRSPEKKGPLEGKRSALVVLPSPVAQHPGSKSKPDAMAKPSSDQPIPEQTPSPDHADQEQTAETIMDKATEAFARGNFDLATAAATKAVKLSKSLSSATRVRALVILAKIQLATQDLGSARFTFEQILAIDPNNAVARKGMKLTER